MQKRNYHRKSVDELTFTDDGMFQAVMHNPDICTELVERLLHIKIAHVEYPELEKTIAPYYSSKGVRLDVYLKDSDKILDIEMQSHPQEELGLRTRYYQSMIDADALMKGQDYPELKSCYILFICKEDPFHTGDKKKHGLSKYTFETNCLEDKDVKINDKIQKVIYNASGYENESDEKIRDFLKFIHTNEPGKDAFSNRISEMVEEIKRNDHFRRDYAVMNLHDRDLQRITRKEALAEGMQRGLKRGIVQGELSAKIEAAVIAVRDFNIPPEVAATKMNAPLDKVLEKLGL